MTSANGGAAASPVTLDHGAIVALIEPLTDLVAAAGAAILEVRDGAWTVDEKSDGSPVTQADLAADRIIAEGLARLAPDVPSLSEERAGLASPPFCGSFFLVDPLDGTKEFIAGRDEFTVNIALVADGTPVLGVIGAPRLGLIWRGLTGWGAQRVDLAATGAIRSVEPIRTRPHPPPGTPWVAAVSRSHGDTRTNAFIAGRPAAVRKELGSAVKFGQLAEGQVDIYPRLSPTSEWDVAAGHALVMAAGGKVTDSRGRPLRFGIGTDTGFIVPEFVAWGDPSAAP